MINGRDAGVVAGNRRQLDVHRLVAHQPMDQRNQETVQDRVPAGEQPSGVRRFLVVEHPGAGA